MTKTNPIEAARYAHAFGFQAVGENRIQEAVDKIEHPNKPEGLRWELIGHLQSNKAKLAVAHFSRVQSVDSRKLLERLNRLAGEAGRRLPVLIQVNAGDDPAKFGVSCDAVEPLVETGLGCEFLELDGLMTIAPLSDDPDVARQCFFRLRELRDNLAEKQGTPLAELSMGMTGDLDHAIAAGSTMIRVGTALYGPREQK